MKKIICFLIVFTIAFSSFCVSAEGLSIFSDVDITTDVGIAVYTLYAEGIVKGMGDGTFGVDRSLTRAECSRMINLLFKYTDAGENIFTDVSEKDWFYDDVNIAVKAGFIVGFEDGTFRGNDPVTRQQVCSIVNRIAKPAAKYDFTVADAVDDWAADDVAAIVNAGLVDIEEGNTFRAVENMTRGELALLLAKFVDDSSYTVDVPSEDDTKDDIADKNTISGGGISIGGSRPTGGSSSGSSSGSGSGSSSSGSGGNTGGSSSGKDDSAVPDEPSFDNTEIIQKLSSMLDEINAATFVGKEKQIINIIKKDMQLTIDAGSTEYIGENYVNEHFSEDIAEARGIYSGMTEAERDKFIGKIAAFDTETLAYLREYFMD